MSALGSNATDAGWFLIWAARMSIKVWIWKPMVAGLAGRSGAVCRRGRPGYRPAMMSLGMVLTYSIVLGTVYVALDSRSL